MVDINRYQQMREKVKSDIDRLRQDRREIDLRQQEIDQQIVKLEKLYADLDALGEDTLGAVPAEISVEMGLTDAVRSILRSTAGTVSPTQVRDRLIQCGFENSKILLPMVHNALRRLSNSKRGEITKLTVNGAYCYQSAPLNKTRR